MRIAQLALEVSLMRRWTSPVIDAAAIFLVVMAAKTAIAEPYYVPSGSMEPTLQIGDELLATKYPYGYSAASLPSFINLPDTQRVLGALPQPGDIVVFRWPGDRSEIWVKRVIGLPGDRIAVRNGHLWINSAAVALKADGIYQAEADDGSYQPIGRFIETLPGNRSHPTSSTPVSVRSTTCRKSWCRRTTCLSWATTATIQPIAGSRSTPAASGCCRSATWSDGSKPWSDRGTLRSDTSRSGDGRRGCGYRGSSPAFNERRIASKTGGARAGCATVV
jgi:signal peptidase I